MAACGHRRAQQLSLAKHFAGIREGLEKTSKAFDNSLGSYERRVRPSGEKLIKLSRRNVRK